MFMSFLKFIIHYLSSSIFHHPHCGDLPASLGWHGKYLRTCWGCLQMRIGLKTDAVITTDPFATEFSSIPQCLKTSIGPISFKHSKIQLFFHQYQSIVAIPFHQPSEGMAWNSPSDTCFIWTVARRIKLQPVKDTELKESAYCPFRLLSDVFHLASSH